MQKKNSYYYISTILSLLDYFTAYFQSVRLCVDARTQTLAEADDWFSDSF